MRQMRFAPEKIISICARPRFICPKPCGIAMPSISLLLLDE